MVVSDPYWLSVLRVVVFDLATEREKRIAAQDVEIKEVRRQAEARSAKNGRLEEDLDHSEIELEVARKETRQSRETQAALAKEPETQRQAHGKMQESLAALREQLAQAGKS